MVAWLIIVISSLLCNLATVQSNSKSVDKAQIKTDCKKDLVHEIFAKKDLTIPNGECPQKETSVWPDFLHSETITKVMNYYQPKAREESLKHIEFLPYALYPQYMDNFHKAARSLSTEMHKHHTDLVQGSSVQFWLGTRDDGRTLLIFFPGTANIKDVEIDITVKHEKVRLAGLLPEEAKYKYPKKYLSGDIKGAQKLTQEEIWKKGTFRVHQGVHSRLWDSEVQRGIQENLLLLYSGTEEMAPVEFPKWVKANGITTEIKAALIKHGFVEIHDQFSGKKFNANDPESLKYKNAGHYTRPKAFRMDSKEMEDFVSDPDVKKKDIEIVIKAVKKIKEKRLKRAQTGIRTTKVEKLIISGHSLDFLLLSCNNTNGCVCM